MQSTSNPYRHADTDPFAFHRGPRSRPFGKAERNVVLVAAVLFATLFVGRWWLLETSWAAPLVFGLVPVGMLVATPRFRLSPRLGVLVAVLALALVRCVWRETYSSWSVVLPTTFAIALALRSRNVSSLEVLTSFGATVAKLPSRYSAFIAGLAKKGRAPIRVLPILVPFGLVSAFGIVFALANPVVAHGLGRAFEIFVEGRLVSIFSVFGFVASALIVIPLLRPAVRFRTTDESIGDRAPRSVETARNALIALDLVFAAYNALDFAHLWGGALPWGTSTQEYAHQGAFWLTVSIAMTTVTAAVLFRSGVVHKRLALLWLAQNVWLGVGTYRRLAMHVQTSGLSSLRIAGMVGTTVVLSGIGLVAWKLFTRKGTLWLLRRQLDVAVLALALFAIAPTHWLSARVNVELVEGGDLRPLVHLREQALQEESAAALLPLLHHPDLRVRQGVAAYLRMEMNGLRPCMNCDYRMDESATRTATGRLLAPHDAEIAALAPQEKVQELVTMIEALQLAANR